MLVLHEMLVSASAEDSGLHSTMEWVCGRGCIPAPPRPETQSSCALQALPIQ